MADLFLFVWVGGAFLFGSLPFSVWITKRFARRDVRKVGDGNPGATNALRAGGWQAGLIVLMLDITKAALPVGAAFHLAGYRGLDMLLICIAPVLGHAYSPFLGWKGGKALATMLGVWIGISLYEVSAFALISLLLLFALLAVDGWAVLFTSISVLAYVVFRGDGLWIGFAIFQLILVAWKHRGDLRKPIKVRKWLSPR